MEFSFPPNLSGDFHLLEKLTKNHSHNKLKRKQLPLWSCFAFITRNIDQNTATKSLYAHKTAGNSHSWKSPYNALQAQCWTHVHLVMYAKRLCLCWHLTDSSCEMATLITSIFRMKAMNAADVTLQLNKYKCVWILGLFCPILWKTSLRYIEWISLVSERIFMA